jgi:hypothetical protein
MSFAKNQDVIQAVPPKRPDQAFNIGVLPGDLGEIGRSRIPIAFLPRDGDEWRTGMNTMPVFVVNSARGFYEQLLASSPDPSTGKPHPARMQPNAVLRVHQRRRGTVACGRFGASGACGRRRFPDARSCHRMSDFNRQLRATTRHRRGQHPSHLMLDFSLIAGMRERKFETGVAEFRFMLAFLDTLHRKTSG